MSKVSKKTRNTVLCALVSALGVIILLLGSVVDVLDLSAGALAGMLGVFVVLEVGSYWPWMTYAVTATLSFLLLPNKFPALIFALTGFYPPLKQKLERLPRVIAWIVKIVVCNAVLTAGIFITSKLFLAVDLTLITGIDPVLNYAILYGAGNLVFILYDIALSKFITYYVFVLRDRLRIGKK